MIKFNLPHTQNENYRPEIDGLRAIAVISVLIYHANFELFGYSILSGGFIGVDIFFVISGYLISAILLREIKDKRFSFLNFYERRARRILPALFLVMLVCIPFAWMHMFPKPFKDFSQSLVSSVLFSSNILFWMEDGYTAEPNALKPFLHTWSLSVEEQYYVIFPVILILLWRFARNHTFIIMGAGLIASLVIADWSSNNIPSAASFFLLHTRGWELLAGAMLAKKESDSPREVNDRFSRFMPLIGLILIVYSLVIFDDSVPHPSFKTAIPILGVAILIWYSGKTDIVTQLLSSKAFVGIGLISYSLYLWHQPIFAFTRIQSVNELSDIAKLLCILLSLTLAYFSWRWVERPFRNKNRISAKTLWSSLGITTVFLLGIGVSGHLYNGFPSRIPQQLQTLFQEKSSGVIDENGEYCMDRHPKDACALGQANSNERWVLIGDSHARVISEDLWSYAKSNNIQFTEMTHTGCHYAPGLEVTHKGIPTNCTNEYNQSRRQRLLEMKPSTLFVHGRLPLYLSAKGFDNQQGGKERFDNYLLKPPGKVNSEQERVSEVIALIQSSLQELVNHGHSLVLIYPVPEVGWNVPFLIQSKGIEGSEKLLDSEITTLHSVFKQRTELAYAVYDTIEESRQVTRIYPEKVFCNTFVKGKCAATHKRSIFYVDSHHLSPTGSDLLVRSIVSKIKTASNNALLGQNTQQ